VLIRSKLLVALLAMWLAVCSTDAGASATPPLSPPTNLAPGSAASAKAGSGSLLAHLAYVPQIALTEVRDTPSWDVQWFDLKRFQEQTGTVLATPLDRTKLFTDGNDRLFVPELLTKGPDFQKDLGVSPGDVTSALDVDYAKYEVTVFRGKFAEDRIDAAMGPDVDNIWSIGPAKDYELAVKKATGVRILGAGLRMTKRDDLTALVVSPSRPVVEAVRGSATKTMADLSPWKEVATALDAANAYSATLAVHPLPSPTYKGDLKPKLERTSVIGLGFFKDKAIAVYAHDSESKARTNQKLLPKQFAKGPSTSREKMSSYVTVDSVTRKGSLVTVILTLLPGGANELRDSLTVQGNGFDTK
jgi:hypothetical protein